jgi:hypothetical protein
MVGADHKGWNMLFILYLHTIVLQINLFFVFISLLEFYIFRILLLLLVIIGINHSEDGKNWRVFATVLLQNNII